MIHYHGIPLSGGNEVTIRVMAGRHVFATFADPAPLAAVADLCSTFALDNGAFSHWKRGQPVDWEKYYLWVGEWRAAPGFDWAVIPDVINGTEQENDDLLEAWPFPRHEGVPVWHLHESLDRLRRLANEWPRIALGSSGSWSTVGNADWWGRINSAMSAICADGRPICKIHGLRMLSPAVFTHIPFSSADSTNVARTLGFDSRWKGTYQPGTKVGKGVVLAERIESHQSPSCWRRRDVHIQNLLF
ncbi:MAG: hypothetical protein HQM04_11515 [Magnetococcales bacterium]|nr:hypothetical protein [Magnetococcales bacterium]MBF0115652.1 hypothetical protein [Magnetococcales bacterium]